VDKLHVVSSVITAVGYDELNSTLEIEFRNGAVYEYSGVAVNAYKALISAASKGQYFDNWIRNGPYSCRRIS